MPSFKHIFLLWSQATTQKLEFLECSFQPLLLLKNKGGGEGKRKEKKKTFFFQGHKSDPT